jgi:hypothetical protein
MDNHLAILEDDTLGLPRNLGDLQGSQTLEDLQPQERRNEGIYAHGRRP